MMSLPPLPSRGSGGGGGTNAAGLCGGVCPTSAHKPPSSLTARLIQVECGELAASLPYGLKGALCQALPSLLRLLMLRS
uniref:Uncharacterized protein n=1 Tax=Knipowitschia caucasica TaxID=637954 RepID=A0AAV2K6L3_KNICA